MNENEIVTVEDIDGLPDENAVDIDTAETTEVIGVPEPVPDNTLTYPQTLFFALGVFLALMFLYFVSQRGSFDGRSS